MKSKTIKLSPQISDHDLSYRIKQAKKFIDKGFSVKFQMVVHGRLRYRKDINYEDFLKSKLNDFKIINTWSKNHNYFLFTNKY